MSVSLTPLLMETAVLFLVFNRPETTAVVFEQIRKAKPPRLYIASDGARTSEPAEHEKVSHVREIATSVDWECQVQTLFREENLGCKLAVSSAVTWFFKHEEMGIVLEDDCMPHPDFFDFCEELLHYYADDTRIGAICGDAALCDMSRTISESYYFSKFFLCWGWAAWRRSWQLFDVNAIESLNIDETDWLFDVVNTSSGYNGWRKKIINVQNSSISSWATIFSCNLFLNSMLTVIPKVNLVSNIGQGSEGATHCLSKSSRFDKIDCLPLSFPLVHPIHVIRNRIADKIHEAERFAIPGLARRIKSRLIRIFVSSSSAKKVPSA